MTRLLAVGLEDGVGFADAVQSIPIGRVDAGNEICQRRPVGERTGPIGENRLLLGKGSQFTAENLDFRRGSYPDPDLVAADLQNFDHNTAVDNDAFVLLAGEYQHGFAAPDKGLSAKRKLLYFRLLQASNVGDQYPALLDTLGLLALA